MSQSHEKTAPLHTLYECLMNPAGWLKISLCRLGFVTLCERKGLSVSGSITWDRPKYWNVTKHLLQRGTRETLRLEPDAGEIKFIPYKFFKKAHTVKMQREILIVLREYPRRDHG